MARQEAGGSYAGGKRFSAILHFVIYLGFFLLTYLELRQKNKKIRFCIG
jgi:hypothetical protein